MFKRRIIANSHGFHYGNGKMGITGAELICINTHSRDYFIIQPSNKQSARFLHVVVCLDFPLDVCVFWCGEIPHHFFAPELKVQAAFANYRRLAGADMLCRAIYVRIECNAPSLKAACTFNTYGKCRLLFSKENRAKPSIKQQEK